MMNAVLTTLTVAAALGCGLNAGFFFAFSAVTMKALGRIPSAQGILAMQTINVVVLNRWFFFVFFGTAAVCMILAAIALLDWQAEVSVYLLCGSGLYLIGTIFVTVAFNVPLNEALARVEPRSAEGERLWIRYLRVWTAWNHVRTIAPLLAAAAFIVTLA